MPTKKVKVKRTPWLNGYGVRADGSNRFEAWFNSICLEDHFDIWDISDEGVSTWRDVRARFVMQDTKRSNTLKCLATYFCTIHVSEHADSCKDEEVMQYTVMSRWITQNIRNGRPYIWLEIEE